MSGYPSYTAEQRKTAEGHVANQPCTLCRDRLDEKTVLYSFHKYGVLPVRCTTCNARRNGSTLYAKMPPNATEFDYWFFRWEDAIKRKMVAEGKHASSEIEYAHKLYDTGWPLTLPTYK
jgi:hypothetical protein